MNQHCTGPPEVKGIDMPWNKSVIAKADGNKVVQMEQHKLPEREIRAQKFASDLYRICRLLRARKGLIVDETSLGWATVEAKMSDDLRQTFDDMEAVLERIEE